MASQVLADSSSYPLLNIFWTMFEFFIWILFFFLLFRIFGDIFRSRDLSGWGKAGWSILIIVLPFVGILIYVIARGGSMHDRDVKAAEQADAAMRTYVQQAAGSGPSDELAKLAALRDQGVITDDEFAAQKAKLLA
jgi:Short C-terminal domain